MHICVEPGLHLLNLAGGHTLSPSNLILIPTISMVIGANA